MSKVKENYNNYSAEELINKIEEEKTMLGKMKFNHKVTPIENPMSIRQIRRNIARMATALSAKN
ncbi:MAG: 50S ribosomal protein L29 [Chitinophagales bacterium]|jgi:large subunit ribosomal protein L29|nr:50S ribosomal protein L29 [Chitinophagales bacterium]